MKGWVSLGLPRLSLRSRRLRVAALGVLATAGVLGLAERDASASGYLAARFGADHGTPAIANPYAVYYNPAAMGGAKGTTITADGTFAYRWAQYNRGENGISPSDPSYRDNPSYLQANTGTATLHNVLATPFLGFMTDFGGTNFRLGAASYVPFGGSAEWDKKDGDPALPYTKDGVQRWQSISGSILALYNTIAASYTIEPADLTIGLNGSLIYHSIKTVRARNADGTDDVTSASGRLVEGRSLVEATGLNFGAGIGLYWMPKHLAGYTMKDRLRIGVSYTSQPGFGQTRMKGTLDQVLSTGKPGVDDIDFLQTYPDIIRAGFAHRFPGDKLELRGDGYFARWSVFKRQCLVKRGADCPINGDGTSDAGTPPGTDVIQNIERNWKDAVGFRFGAAYFFDYPGFEVFGSGGFSTPAAPKSTMDAATIDSQRISGTIGIRKVLFDHLTLAGSYNHIFFLPVDTGDNNTFDQLRGASKTPSADGKYASQIGFVNANVSYTF